ncbi:MAG: cytochrome c biogenesis protein CcsA [Candidatus Omnitrophica bacterium]|nr:cytochrome c biogenesis protein CcsA [Candidatus Omnitrophota bacterium]
MNILHLLIIFLSTLVLVIIGFAGFDSLQQFFAGRPGNQIYFGVHVAAAFSAYFCFAFSFIAGLLYLYQDHLLKKHKPVQGMSLEALEKGVFGGLLAGLPILTLALFSGFAWLKTEFGTFWLWNSKLISSVLAWLIYTALFYFHFFSAVRGRKMVILSVLAFSSILLIFLGLSFFDAQIHRVQ